MSIANLGQIENRTMMTLKRGFFFNQHVLGFKIAVGFRVTAFDLAYEKAARQRRGNGSEERASHAERDAERDVLPRLDQRALPHN